MLTRRALVFSPAALAAAAAVPPAPVRLPRKLRVAILGLDGHVGEIVDQATRLPDIEIVAVCDADSKAVTKLMSKPQLAKAKAYSDARQMLENEKLIGDRVFLAQSDQLLLEMKTVLVGHEMQVAELADPNHDFRRVQWNG